MKTQMSSKHLLEWIPNPDKLKIYAENFNNNTKVTVICLQNSEGYESRFEFIPAVYKKF